MDIKPLDKFLNEIEASNIEVIEHYERVAMMTYAFAKELGLNSTEKDRLYWIGLLHEIGKYKMEGYEHLYPLVTAAILRSHEEFAKIAHIVLQCEENIDGSGYPFHLTGESIHLYATITHLCDTYDHLRMQGLNHDDAVLKLRTYNNIICPKKLITTFLKMLINNEELMENYIKGETQSDE